MCNHIWCLEGFTVNGWLFYLIESLIQCESDFFFLFSEQHYLFEVYLYWFNNISNSFTGFQWADCVSCATYLNILYTSIFKRCKHRTRFFYTLIEKDVSQTLWLSPNCLCVCVRVSLFCSGMKPLNFSGEACRSGGTGRISAATTGASLVQRRWITSMTSWDATTTLVLRWPGTRLCSSWGSSSRLTWWKISKGGMEQKNLKTTVICTGALLFCLVVYQFNP